MNIPHRRALGLLHMAIDIESASATRSCEPAKGIMVAGSSPVSRLVQEGRQWVEITLHSQPDFQEFSEIRRDK